MIKAIITDVDGTLYRQGPVRRYVAAVLLRYALVHPVSAWRTLRALRAYRQAQELLRAHETPGDAHQQAACAASQTGYSEAFVNACVHRWMEREPLPALLMARSGGVESFCRWAVEKGLRLGALSDYDPREKLRALNLNQYFQVVVCAQDEDVGVFKPNPRGLHFAMKRLGVEQNEAVYVGDRLEVDAATAVASGVPGILISSHPTVCPPGVVVVRGWPAVRTVVQNLVDTRPSSGQHEIE